MKKDYLIIDLINVIKDKINNNITIVDYWDADLCAIGFMNKNLENRLIYVSTYEKPEGHYYYECETFHPKVPDEYQVVEKCEDVDREGLLKKIEEFLFT